MPTPENLVLTLEQTSDGSFNESDSNALSDEQKLAMLRSYAEMLEARIRGSGISVQPQQQSVIEKTQRLEESTLIHQPTDECDVPNKMQGQLQQMLGPALEMTPIQVKSPEPQQQPWFSKGCDMLEELLKYNEITEGDALMPDAPTVETPCCTDTLSTFAPQQTAQPSQENELAPQPVDVELPTLSVVEQQEGTSMSLPSMDLPLAVSELEMSYSFELDEAAPEQLTGSTDPLLPQSLPAVLTSAPCMPKDAGVDSTPQLDVDMEDMGPYRDPPSVSSVSTLHEYQSLLSPQQNEFEAFDETNVSSGGVKARIGAVVAQRQGRRRSSGGKDVKRLHKKAKQPYPSATARNGRLSKCQYEVDYKEDDLNDGWWKMLKAVENLYRSKTNFDERKVEDLRRFAHDLFAVGLFPPSLWGNNQKRKGIYKEERKEEYRWPEHVPFRSLNNTPKPGDAPRANKADLVAISNFLMERYIQEIRPKVHIFEGTRYVRLQGITADGRIETPAAAVDAGMDLPTPLDLPQLVPTAVPVKPDLPSAAVSGPQQVSQMVTDTEANGVTSTVDLTELMQLLNSNANVLSVSDGSQSMYSLNIEPRPTPVEPPAVYVNPEQKLAWSNLGTPAPAPAPADLVCKDKDEHVEHNYSAVAEHSLAFNNVSGKVTLESGISGAVLTLAEQTGTDLPMEMTPNKDAVSMDDNADVCVQRLKEAEPQMFSQVIEVLEALNKC